MYNRNGVMIMVRYDAENLSIILRDKRYQGNPLVQARKDFDITGMKIFLLGLRELIPYLSKRDEFLTATLKELFIPTAQLTEVFGDDTWHLKDLERVCGKMFQSVIKFQLADEDFEQYHLFRKLKFVTEEGLYIWFDDILRPHILDLFKARKYTLLNIKYLFRLTSIYAVRLLELMLLYQDIEPFKERQEITCKFTLEELRFALKVAEGAYEDRKDNFRRFVLDVAIKDIMKRTPYILRYETLKERGKLSAIKIVMDMSNVPAEDNDERKPPAENKAIIMLLALGFGSNDAQEIFRKCRDEDDCLSRINRAQGLLDRQSGLVANKLGFLRRAIESEWHVGRNAARRGESGSSILPLEYENSDLITKKSGKILVGRKKMSYRLAETMIDHIRRGNTDLVGEYLSEYKVDIEKFVAICEKHGL